MYLLTTNVDSLVHGPETGRHRWNSWNCPPGLNVCMEWFHWLCVVKYTIFPETEPFYSFLPYSALQSGWLPLRLVSILAALHTSTSLTSFCQADVLVIKSGRFQWYIYVFFFASWTWTSNLLGVEAGNLISPLVHYLTTALFKTLRETWMMEKKTSLLFMARRSAKSHSFPVQVGCLDSWGEINDWACFIQRLHIQYITVATGLGCVYLER